MTTEWCIAVWNGTEWFTGPVVYESEREAVLALASIRFAPAIVHRCGDPLPTDPPREAWQGRERRPE